MAGIRKSTRPQLTATGRKIGGGTSKNQTETRAQFLTDQPKLKTNQDLINYFTSGNDWSGAEKKAASAGFNLNDLVKDRSAQLQRPVTEMASAGITEAGTTEAKTPSLAQNILNASQPYTGSLPDLGKDSFALAPAFTKKSSALKLTDAAKEKRDGAVNGLKDTIASVFDLSAKDLALGKKVPQSASDLSAADQTRLQDATKNMLLEMPVASLAPELGGKLKTLLEKQGIDTQGFEAKSLKELGEYGGEFAKKMADNLKDSSPATFYGLATAGALAVGAYGVTQGSAALEKLGIKPEFDGTLLNDQLALKAKSSWEAGFKDPNLQMSADGTFKVGKKTQLSAGGNVDVQKGELKSADANLGIEREGDSLKAKAAVGEKGKFKSGEIEAVKTYISEAEDAKTTTLKGAASFGEKGVFTGATASAAHSRKFGEENQNNLSADAAVKLGEKGKFESGQASGEATWRSEKGDASAKTTTLKGAASFGEKGVFTGATASAAHSRKFGEENQNNLSADAAVKLGEKGKFESGQANLKMQVKLSKSVGADLNTANSFNGEGKLMGSEGGFTFKKTLAKEKGSLSVGGDYKLIEQGKFESGKAFLSGDFKFGTDQKKSLDFKSTANLGLRGKLLGTETDVNYTTVGKGDSIFKLSGSLSTDERSQILKASLGGSQKKGGFEKGLGLDFGAKGQFENVTGFASYANEDRKLTGSVKAKVSKGLKLKELDLSLNKGLTEDWSGSLSTSLSDGKFTTLDAGVKWKGEKSFLEANVEHDFSTDATQGKLSYGYRPNQRMDFSIEGSMGLNGQGQQNNRIGVGFKYRF